MIIAISGKIGSGKDTVGKIIQYLTMPEPAKKYLVEDWLNKESYLLQTHSGWEIKKFAFKLKQMVAMLTGCTVEDLESQEFKNKELPEEWNWFRGSATDSEGHSVWTRLNPTEEAKKVLPFPNRIKPYTYRELLQRFGTEAIRFQIHENAWSNALFADYKPLMTLKEYVTKKLNVVKINDQYFEEVKNNYVDNYVKESEPKWLVTDLRFPNELFAVKKRNGITLRVNRPKPKVSTGDKITDHVLNNTRNFGIVEHPSETALDNAEFDYVINNDGTLEELIEKVKQILIKENIINEVQN